MAQALSLKSLQSEMAALQEKMVRAVEQEKQQLAASNYTGPDYPIKLQISDKVFISSAKTLFKPQHGKNNLFLQQLHPSPPAPSAPIKDDIALSTDAGSIDFKSAAAAGSQLEGACIDNIARNDEKEQDIIAPGQVSRVSEMFFDRDASIFSHILAYMRGYDIKPKLLQMDGADLKMLLADCQYFGLDRLQQIVSNVYNNKFCSSLCSAFIELNNNCSVAVRSSMNVNLHQSAPLNHAMYLSDLAQNEVYTRYVEFRIVSAGTRYIMIGVTEAEAFRVSPYPGHASVPGCSVYGANGHLYTKGAHELWSKVWVCGDSVGMLLKMDAKDGSVTLQYYHNGTKVKGEIDLKHYMNVEKGVLFNVNLYSHLDTVQIVQDAKEPRQ